MLKTNKKFTAKDDKLQIIKDVPDKDIELTLELEMDEEVKDIISCPEKYGNTMLDVTVIKPKLDKLGTAQKKIMSGEEVKKFIAAMSSTKPNLIPSNPTPKSTKLGTTVPKPSLTKPKSPLDRFAPPSPRTTSIVEESASEVEKEHVKQVYTASASKTFTDLNSLFQCKNNINRDKNLKPEEPCTCKNCSIVGILADSQKRPFTHEAMHAHSAKHESKDTINRKRKSSSHHHKEDNCYYYYKELSEKIKILEARITVQEERSVAKDYFKKIITKIMNHITKVTNYASQFKMEIPYQKPKPPPSRDKYDKYSQKYIINQVNTEKDKEEPTTSTGTFWRWGEDFLKPGIDLKNKIILLMEETLNNFKSKEKPKDDEIKQFVEELSTNLYKTIQQTANNHRHERESRGNSASYKNDCKKHGHRKKMDEPVSVTYVNSKILKWKETETTFRFESDKETTGNVDQKFIQDLYKSEFIKTLKNTRDEDKQKLWYSIWSQALKNRQDKSDKVTIQIPDRRDPKRKHVEIAYTLGDLEYLLLGEKNRNR